MIKDYTRGSQLLIHQMRMLRQSLKTALYSSILIFIISYSLIFFTYKNKLPDTKLVKQYIKLNIYHWLNINLHNLNNKTKLNNYSNYKNSYKNYGLRNKQKLKNNFNKWLYIQIFNIKYSLYISFISFIFSVGICSRYGKNKSKPSVSKGTDIMSQKIATNLLIKSNEISSFTIAKLPMVKNFETSHTLITGTTGSGKSNCIQHFIKQIRDKKHTAVIVDFTGEIKNKYFKENHDILINPYLKDSYQWDFWNDASDQESISFIANSLFDSNNQYDPMWNRASSIFFEDAVSHINKKPAKTLRELKNILMTENINIIHSKLKNTPSASLLDPQNEKTALSIRTNTISFIDWLNICTRHEYEQLKDKISINQWCQNIDKENDKWLFLTASPIQRSKLKNFYSLLLDLIMANIMQLGPSKDRRIWLIIDELPALKKIPSLPIVLAEFRKYGGCVLAGVQSPSQLYNIYGYNQAMAMLDQFNTKFIFRTEDQKFSSYLSDIFGHIDYSQHSENFMYGYHESRDGINFTKQDKKKPVILPSDLASLSNLECIVKMSHPKVRAVKLKMNYLE